MIFENDSIIIVPNNDKIDFIKELRINYPLLNAKVFTEKEFLEEYTYTYQKKAVFFVMEKEDVIPEIAQIYIENCRYISTEKNYNNEKLDFLVSLRKKLEQKKLLEMHSLFKKALEKKTVYFYHILKPNSYIIKELEAHHIKTVFIREEPKNVNPILIEGSTLKEEVLFVVCEIIILIKQGIELSHIFLVNLDSDYRNMFSKYLNLFHIPFSFHSEDKLIGLSLTQEIIEKEFSEEVLISVHERIKTEKEEEAYKQIISILNQYAWASDFLSVKDLIIKDLRNANLSLAKKTNAICEKSFLENDFTDEDYVFLVGANQGTFPIIYKDENYLSDKELAILKLDATKEKNQKEKEAILSKIKTVMHLTISYKKMQGTEEMYKSSILEEINKIKKEGTLPSIQFSKTYSKLVYAEKMDTFLKYGEKSPELETLSFLKEKGAYRKYDNTYKKIQKEIFLKYLPSLNVSYTSLDAYFKCGFRYYLNSILKIAPYEETFTQKLGTFFHNVLENVFISSSDFDTIYKECQEKINFMTPKEQFFVENLKEELKFVVNTIKEQLKDTELTCASFETKITIPKQEEIPVVFSGIIDKLLYTKEKDAVVVIDYKTGNPKIDLNKAIYGLDFQLPTYLYLLKNSEFKNAQVIGIYLQKIVHEPNLFDEKKKIEQIKKENLKLQGYSTRDQELLKRFDPYYANSHLIKSMRTKNDGDFMHYSKVLSNDEFASLSSLAEQKIEEGIKSILNAEFPINPKKTTKEMIGCTFCPFKSICNVKYEDYVTIKEYEKLEFLGGETHADMDNRTTISH